MKNQNLKLIFVFITLLGLAFPSFADQLNNMQNMILNNTDMGLEDCAADYVKCADNVKASDKAALIQELKSLEESKQKELMNIAIKGGKVKAVGVFIEAEILPDSASLILANDKIIKKIRENLMLEDKCILVNNAIEENNDNLRVLQKTLELFTPQEFSENCSMAVLVDNYKQNIAATLLKYVGGETDNLRAYMNNGKQISLLAYNVLSKITGGDFSKSLETFLISNGADMEQELYPGSGRTLQELLEIYEENGEKPLNLY